MASEHTITGGTVVLLTGGSGFLGTAIVNEILADSSPLQVRELRIYDVNPMNGQVECSEVILASGDMVAIDVEGVKLLQSYNAPNKLDMDVWELPQIAHAVEIGIGATCDDDIKLVTDTRS